MTERICPNCRKPYEAGDEVCRYCGSMLPFSTAVLTPGKVLRQRYEIQGLAHSGGMGYVYLAKDKTLFGKSVIVKQVKETVKSDTDRRRLEEEALRMSKLSHSNAAMILDQFVEGGYYFLVVQHISGKTLSQVLEDRRGPLTEEDVLRWAISMCDVVSYLHGKGVIHRDISPENIMLTDEGAIMFIDFGTMRELRQITSQKTAGIGKFGFTPPEQWQGRPVAQSDIFAIGATVYYLLTEYLPLSAEYQRGQKPQSSDFRPSFPLIRQKNPGVSQELEAVLEKALQLDVNSRYQSAHQLGQALRSLKKGEVKTALAVRVGAAGDDSTAPEAVKPAKAAASGGWFTAGVALLIIGLLVTGLGLALAVSVEENAVASTILVTVLFILPFMIPGVLCLRRGIAQGPLAGLAKGNTSNWWWSLPALLGFVGGIISWVRQKDVNRRKAMNMLTLGIILTAAWPTLAAAAPLLFSQPTRSPALSVAPKHIYLSDLEPGTGSVSESFTVTGTGSGTMIGTLATNRDWLDVSPTQIEVTHAEQEIKVHVDTAGLSYGSRDTGRIEIATNAGHAEVSVTFTTVEAPVSAAMFEDDFSDPSSGWKEETKQEAEWSYENGGWRVLVKKGDVIAWGRNAAIGRLDDFALEIDTRALSPPGDSAYAVVFRAEDFDNYYIFSILSAYGKYYIGKYTNKTRSDLKDWTDSSYIQKGTLNNHLKIVCKGAEITVYVNGHELVTVTDYSFLKGDIGLGAVSGPGSKADVLFDNLRIYAAD